MNKKTRLSNFTFQYVSINTKFSDMVNKAGLAFTFQYVSINTHSDLDFHRK